MEYNFFKTNIAYENWKEKYRNEDENPLETFQRIAKTLANNEKDPDYWYPIFLNTLLKFDENQPTGIKCSPGGRITANIGTKHNGATLINCFIAGPVKNAKLSYIRKNDSFENKVTIKTKDTADDLINIFFTIMEQAKTLASEGGWGINFDFIRPRGSLIKGTGIRHPGVVSYMEVFDTVANCIIKGNNDGYVDTIKNYLTKEESEEFFGVVDKLARKGAMMGVLSCNHPDIEEFVRAKQESGRLTKFNISVLVTNEFMNAVEHNELWELKWEGKVVKRIKAKDLYDLIMKSTYNRAEPGILFKDNMNLNNPILYLGETNATNPCIRKGTLAKTECGLELVEDVIEKRKIQTTLGYGDVEEVKVYNDQDIYRVTFSDGFYQDVTNGHIFHTMDGSHSENRKCWNNEKRLNELKIGDSVRKQWYNDFPNIINDVGRNEGLLIGLYLGNGCFSNGCSFNISCDSTEDNSYIEQIYSYFGADFRIDKGEGDCVRYYMTGKNDFLRELFSRFEILEHKNINMVKLLNTNKEFICGLIDGLLSSDGNINLSSRYPQVRFKNTSMQIHTLLKHLFLFVKADYKLNLCGKKGDIGHIYGREVKRTKDIYEGIIDNDSILHMYENIKFLSHNDKNEKLKKIIKTTQLNGVKWKTKIISIDHIGKDTVYDLYEPNADDWNHEGYVSRGCGEINGNPDMTTVCLLGSLNLTQYVKIVDGKAVFDFDLYKSDIRVFARMLDNVCDISTLPLPSYEWVVKNLRQFGMGLNGVGSTLLMLDIPYNSQEAVSFVKEITELKENITIQESALLAKEKGAFPLFDWDKYTNTPYFKSDRLSPETKELVKKYGVRNAKTTTSPPLGASSIFCDYVSNGIEPLFALETERKVICQWPEGLNSSNVKNLLKEKKQKDFVYWEGEYNGKQYYYEPHNRGICEKHILRDYGYQWVLDNFPERKNSASVITTEKLSVDDHMNIQEVVQYYNNQSTSKTINLPNKYSFDRFKQLYFDGWKRGLVGLTTYRSGSMESVLESLEIAEEKREIIKKGVKLPSQFINGPTKTIKKEGMKFYIHFSYIPEDTEMKYPVAIWLHTNQKGETVACNRACKSLGKLALECGIDNKLIETTWDKCLGDSAHNRLGRMISFCLRHNIPREDILVSLTGIEGDHISTLLTTVRKFIAETIEDGKELIGMKCPSCGNDKLIMQSGCFTCIECSYAGCG